ncbi:hypothetical protein LOTGIDRAFT_158420 [Lottia gigantea]|uniref:Uncharacterized protein n=1 Tax=Lottia gigantea TaxID=225164 RepID=V4CBW7_LOTGI|nr:hypothetical protein LOTGIDRAFT_158420 [Lottia gigantea]ESO99334.1 hypothetical protein LOTGIDRAFT_158420 [Lottia gigantea]
MNEFLDKYGTDTTTNFQLMRWTNELNISPFYYCMRDEINDLKYKKETKKPNSTTWINKAKPYFVDQIGDTLQGDLDMNNFSITNSKSPENDNDAIHKKYLREQIYSIEDKIAKQKLDIQQLIDNIPDENEDTFQQELNALETKLNSELQKELTNIKKQIQNIDDSEIKTYIQQQIQNIDDSEIKTYIHQQIQNIDDSVIQQQITTINNLVLKQDKNIVALEKKFLKKESYYFNLPFKNLRDYNTSITDIFDRSRDYEYKKYGITANIRVYSPTSINHPQYIFDSNLDLYSIPFIFHGKITIEITFPFQVKVDSIFFKQISYSSNIKFIIRKVLQFINGTKNVETKELEINDENTMVDHLYEIKTSGKYIDRFRMLIIPDKEKHGFILRDFDMILETETPPSMNIIRNPEPQKETNSYEFLRATEFEYVKLYFVDNDIFTSNDIHKSQQKQTFLIRDDAYVYSFY